MHLKKLPLSLMFGLMFGTIAVSAEFYNRAPDVLPGTLPEMNTTAFWIAKMKAPDEVILTPSAIQAMNVSYLSRMKAPDPFKGVDKDRIPNHDDLNRWPGRYIVLPDLASMTPAQIAAAVREEVAKDINFMRGKYSKNVLGLKSVEFKEFGNMLGIKYTDWELDRFEKEMAPDLIGSTVTPLDAVTVSSARLRIVPTFTPEQVGLMENGKARWDVWTVNIVRVGAPVSVLHSSRSGGYVFVLSPEGYGWIKTEETAFAPKADITKFSRPALFVVCTGDRVPYYSDESCRYASGWLRLGDRLPLVSQANHRQVFVPVRRANGRLATEQAWLAKDADVHVGWLPYTRRNVVTTAFKMMGNPYDWSMAWYGRNHETTLRDLFACFGFELPFNAELFTFFSDNKKRVVRPAEGKAEQYKAILANEPFITIQTCGGGHCQLFLGEHNGEPIVLDTTGYGYDKDGVRCEVRRLTVSNMSMPEYFLKTNFTFCELK
ncbi:MAG: SH3 domain-containing protein [Candidatus Latescibacter sp.]|nr:SH3 domain-containing protein [Candidatus Latescibacter sp.]